MAHHGPMVTCAPLKTRWTAIASTCAVWMRWDTPRSVQYARPGAGNPARAVLRRQSSLWANIRDRAVVVSLARAAARRELCAAEGSTRGWEAEPLRQASKDRRTVCLIFRRASLWSLVGRSTFEKSISGAAEGAEERSATALATKAERRASNMPAVTAVPTLPGRSSGPRCAAARTFLTGAPEGRATAKQAPASGDLPERDLPRRRSRSAAGGEKVCMTLRTDLSDVPRARRARRQATGRQTSGGEGDGQLGTRQAKGKCPHHSRGGRPALQACRR